VADPQRATPWEPAHRERATGTNPRGPTPGSGGFQKCGLVMRCHFSASLEARAGGMTSRGSTTRGAARDGNELVAQRSLDVGAGSIPVDPEAPNRVGVGVSRLLRGTFARVALRAHE